MTHVYHLLVRITTLEPVPDVTALAVEDAVTECFEEELDSQDVNRAELLEHTIDGEYHLMPDLHT